MKLKNWIRRWSLCLLATTMTHSAFTDEVGFDATIPVLDMNEYFDPTTKDQFVGKLYDALKEVGFFAVINTGVDPAVLDHAYQACFDFFALPKEKKMEVCIPSSSGQRGYIPGESAKGASSGDFKEFYHVGREMDLEKLQALNIWPNIWPKEFDLKEPLNQLFNALETYMGPLEMAMAEAIGAPLDLFSNMTQEGDVLMRAIHYPSNPPQNSFWAAEHTDIDLFTILPRATADGLQVKNPLGEWVDVKVPEKAFIINGGDMLENITNGEFRSGLHRVIAKKGDYERFSIVYFVHPRARDRLDPIPECITRTGGVQRYAVATRLELLAERLVELGLASDTLFKYLADSGLTERQIALGRGSIQVMQKLKDAGLASEIVLDELNKHMN